jgi:hypothetical protein
MGLYDDPWNRFGHLNQEILRANRLVIDTGLHAMGWDVARGVDWMMQHSSMNREQASAEVERYVAYPGQALSYKIGELKIRELRRRAEKSLAGRFDVKAFHDQILDGGSMPLSILEQGVDRWIRERHRFQSRARDSRHCEEGAAVAAAGCDGHRSSRPRPDSRSHQARFSMTCWIGHTADPS